MEQEHLAWLDEDFLASALQEEYDSKVTIVKFSSSQAVAAGNNYTSHMYRVKVEFTVEGSDLQGTSLIVKIPITKGIITEIADGYEFHYKEPRIYKEVLPMLSKIVNCEFGPRFFNCPVKNGIILKDLNKEGYVICDKFKQLDFSHCELVYMTLAKFHASSVACYHKNPELIEELGKDVIFLKKSKMLEEFVKSSVKCFEKVLSEMEGCEHAVELILDRADHMVESIADMCQPKPSGLNVLNHGDLWINNMLFKHSDSGEVEDVRFIDFQISRWSSPVLDLVYFLWTSADEEVRGHRQKELFSLYLQTLNSNLEQLGCPERLSAQELEDDHRAASDYVLLTISGTLPLILSESDDAVNMEEITTDDFKSGNAFEHLYNSKRFRAFIPKMMEQFQKWIAS
uniref:CHK kinase-like domain-containing protein n=1 Tax=Cuerna arida TaxID=1464854 RepID=A0A1B6EV79_9HEMI